jgi:hypothetical protein
MSGIVTIDFQTFILMVVGIFGLVGFLRGWWKEALTTGLLVLLLWLLTKPTLAASIIDFINQIIRLIVTFFTAGSLQPTEIASAAGTVEAPTINPSQFQPYIIILIILIIFSYFTGNVALGDVALTPIARIFGGILGLVNGFIIVSLIREYMLGRFLPESGVSAAAAVPASLSVTVSNVPQTSIMDGITPWFFILAGAFILLLALGTRYKYTSGRLSRQPPLGYRAAK